MAKGDSLADLCGPVVARTSVACALQPCGVLRAGPQKCAGFAGCSRGSSRFGGFFGAALQAGGPRFEPGTAHRRYSALRRGMRLGRHRRLVGSGPVIARLLPLSALDERSEPLSLPVRPVHGSGVDAECHVEASCGPSVASRRGVAGERDEDRGQGPGVVSAASAPREARLIPRRKDGVRFLDRPGEIAVPDVARRASCPPAYAKRFFG